MLATAEQQLFLLPVIPSFYKNGRQVVRFYTAFVTPQQHRNDQ